MCARVDTGKENQDKHDKGKGNMTYMSNHYGSFVMFIIRNIPEQKYFADIKTYFYC